MSSGKRPHSTIDLTGDEDIRPSPKHPRSSQPQSSQSLNPRDEYQWGIGSTQAEANVEDDIIDASQQEAEEGFGWTCVGAIDGKIVGCRFYSGYASMGEAVLIKREPSNPYDSNAIRIDNVQGTQIGHIPRNLAEKLAGLLDRRAIILEGNLSGEKGYYDCPINLKVFGPIEPNARKALEDELKSKRVPIKKRGAAAPKPPKQAIPTPPTGRKEMGFQSSQSSGMSQPAPLPQPELDLQHFVNNAERFRPRDIERLAEEWGAPEKMLANMPMADQPKGLKSTLLPYQRQGLAWMLSKENPILPTQGSTDVVQLWKRSVVRPDSFQNIATQYTATTPPALAKGGILADDMGLGKTLQVISLILEGGPGCTLIVAPVSVMSNWVQQAERHVNSENALKILTYHGSSRKQMTGEDFAKYDIVVTTYGTLGTEYIPRGAKNPVSTPTKHGLFSTKFRRVVLDEGHQIRNPTTRAALAANALMADSRWVLTGTPIVNTIKDLYSMLKFLRITGGLERLELFNAIVSRPLASGDPNAEILLQTIMRTMCLRRKKDMKFVDLKLPELSEYVHRIQFRTDERKKYEALLAEAKGTLSKALAGKGQSSYRHVLEVLLRLRQVCCHWKLCSSRVADLLSLLESEEGQAVELNNETRLALQALLQISIESHEDCAICLEELHNPVITTCKHAFGKECIERVIETQHKCPMCRAELKDTDCLVHPAVEENLLKEEEIDVDTKSSKTEALMSILAASRKDPLSKVVIFSQWTSFLDIIEHQIKEAGYKFARIDGTMTAPARDAATRALDSNPECRILLASLAVAGVGLNLVAADTVILADSWWAPAIEDQAVDRVHRLGQMRPCTVWRLVMEDSIEERVLGVQGEKRELVGKAFKEKAKGGKGKTTRMGDIQKLLA